MGRKGFIQLTLPCCCSPPKEVRTGTQAGEEAGADAEAMEGCSYWLAPPGLLSLLSYRMQDYQPRDGTTHKGTYPLDHELRKCLKVGSHGGISSPEVPFSVITPACVKLTQIPASTTTNQRKHMVGLMALAVYVAEDGLVSHQWEGRLLVL